MKLLKSQKDTLYNLIIRANLIPDQFYFKEKKSIIIDTEACTVMKFNESDYYFIFETIKQTKRHYAIFCPGDTTYEERCKTESWENQKKQFYTWLGYLRREIAAPNKWARLRKEIESININFDQDDDKFTVSEYEEIKNRLNIIKERIEPIGLLPNQLEAINGKLDFLSEQAKKMTKFNWKSLFVGIIANLIVRLSITKKNAFTIWDLIKDGFNQYILP